MECMTVYNVKKQQTKIVNIMDITEIKNLEYILKEDIGAQNVEK